MHPEAWTFVEESVVNEAPEDVLDLGGWPGEQVSLRSMFHAETEYVCVDERPGVGVDVVADAATHWAGRTFDVVLCTEVLEHTPKWREIIATVGRHTRTGGVAVITAACDPRAPHSCRDGVGGPLQDGEYYLNVDPNEVLEVARGHFTDIEISVLPRGDVRIRARGV